MKAVLNAFRERSPGNLDVIATQANAAEFASQSTIELIAKMENESADQRTKLEKQEMKDKHAYRMQMQDCGGGYTCGTAPSSSTAASCACRQGHVRKVCARWRKRARAEIGGSAET